MFDFLGAAKMITEKTQEMTREVKELKDALVGIADSLISIRDSLVEIQKDVKEINTREIDIPESKPEPGWRKRCPL